MKPHLLPSILMMLLVQQLAIAAEPLWFKTDALKRSGSILMLNCSGSGPSLDLARRSSLASCRTTAIDQAGTHLTVRTLTVQTERDASLHEEITSNTVVTGLDCEPLKEESEEQPDSSMKSFLRCRFDLRKAKFSTVPDVPKSKNAENADRQLLEEAASNSMERRLGSVQSPALIQDETQRTVIFSVVPQCDSILIRSKKARTVQCSSNPLSVIIYPKVDEELIIRREGYTPKHFNIRDRAPSSSREGVIDVYLEK